MWLTLSWEVGPTRAARVQALNPAWSVASVTEKRKKDGSLQGTQRNPSLTVLVWDRRGEEIDIRNQKEGKYS